MIRLSLKVDSGGVKNAMREHAITSVSRRLLANRSIISSKIGNHLSVVFDDTAVARGLRGMGETDLPAELGLSDGDAKALADGMSQLIKESVAQGSFKSSGQFVCRIRALSKNWEKFLQLPHASYISMPSKKLIPVMQWMLLDPNIDIGQASYDIVYNTGAEGVSFKNSRSGRAVMVGYKRLDKFNLPFRSGGYVLPGIFQHVGGKNFIEYVLGQESVADHVFEIIKGVLA